MPFEDWAVIVQTGQAHYCLRLSALIAAPLTNQLVGDRSKSIVRRCGVRDKMQSMVAAKTKLAIISLAILGGMSLAEQPVSANQPAPTVNQNRSAIFASGPVLSMEEFFRPQTKSKNISSSQLRALRSLYDQTPVSSPDAPELLFRLANSYAEQRRYWNDRGTALDPLIAKAAGYETDTLKRKQAGYFKAEQQSLANAIKTYTQLAKEPSFLNYPRMDEVLFYFGSALAGTSQVNESRKVFHRLIKNYPQSKFIPRAYLSFAEYFFAKNNFQNAAAFYDKVIQFPNDVKAYPFALYRRGWVHLHQDLNVEALEVFFKVSQVTAKTAGMAALRQAVQRDFVLAYSRVGRPSKAYSAFQRVDPVNAFAMLTTLASLYVETGFSEKAISSYRQLLSLKTEHPDACLWQASILGSTRLLGSPGRTQTEVETLIRIYSDHENRGILKGAALTTCRGLLP